MYYLLINTHVLLVAVVLTPEHTQLASEHDSSTCIILRVLCIVQLSAMHSLSGDIFVYLSSFKIVYGCDVFIIRTIPIPDLCIPLAGTLRHEYGKHRLYLPAASSIWGRQHHLKNK